MNITKKKIIKVIKVVFVTIVIVYLLGLLGGLVYQNYNSKNWRVSGKLNEIPLGMTRSDVFFFQGSNVTYKPEGKHETAKKIIIMKEPEFYGQEKIDYIGLDFNESDEVETVTLYNIGVFYARNHNIPYTTTYKLKEHLGEPDIHSEFILGNARFRSYTYLDTGYTFAYEFDNLSYITYGKVRWRAGYGRLIRYSIDGKEICPSPNCPFDDKIEDEYKIKSEYKDKDYRYFLN